MVQSENEIKWGSTVPHLTCDGIESDNSYVRTCAGITLYLVGMTYDMMYLQLTSCGGIAAAVGRLESRAAVLLNGRSWSFSLLRHIQEANINQRRLDSSRVSGEREKQRRGGVMGEEYHGGVGVNTGIIDARYCCGMIHSEVFCHYR